MDNPPSIVRIDELAGVQQRIWRASRIAWWGMAAMLLLAAGGAFGDGPLAHREAEAEDRSLRVGYDRFQRADAASPLTVDLARRGPAEEPAFCLDDDFLETWRVSRIEPEPLRAERRASGLCYALAGGAEAPPRLPVRLWVHPQHFSLAAEGKVSVPGGASVTIAALVWP